MCVDYDTFASMSPARKNEALHDLMPENKAELVTTHWQRFLDANRSRLTAGQTRRLELIIEKYPEHAITETELRELFEFEDFIELHFGAFKNR